MVYYILISNAFIRYSEEFSDIKHNIKVIAVFKYIELEFYIVNVGITPIFPTVHIAYSIKEVPSYSFH
ncbi:hypothetical protein NQ317_019889 [Molorchus minor]|uniref:Uncharacterized protein n=1 Tax=Molorchus minor TaxID=1323400 RepID=A0ABQ9J9P0_9CUCU|nr:hypothetical protein NQ317_019889 [Molorchus minor]